MKFFFEDITHFYENVLTFTLYINYIYIYVYIYIYIYIYIYKSCVYNIIFL